MTTPREDIERIKRTQPVHHEITTVKIRGGPGSWSAVGALVGIVLVLLIAIWTLTRQNQQQVSQDAQLRVVLSQLQDVANSNAALLAEVRAAVDAGPPQTAKAVLDLINDNRRIHGCVTVDSLEELHTAPPCVFKPASTVVTVPVPVAVPVPVTTPPAPPDTAPAPAPATPDPFTRPCKLGLLGICIIS